MFSVLHNVIMHMLLTRLNGFNNYDNILEESLWYVFLFVLKLRLLVLITASFKNVYPYINSV